jgi:hypothetical protein
VIGTLLHLLLKSRILVPGDAEVLISRITDDVKLLSLEHLSIYGYSIVRLDSTKFVQRNVMTRHAQQLLEDILGNEHFVGKQIAETLHFLLWK